ncbi:hypothetical protein KI387_000494, partial [Taxus chinensis]
DIPMDHRPYRRIDAEAPFSPPRPTLPEGLEEIVADRKVMDAGATVCYRLWWAVELRSTHERADHPDIAVITMERDLLQGLVHQLQTQVNETTGLLEATQSRVERVEERVLHARGQIRMLQDRLVDQWEELIAVVPLSTERP